MLRWTNAMAVERVVYDVGMHKNEDTEFYLERGMRVIGVEANPILVDELRNKFTKDVENNRLAIVDKAISRANGTALFAINKRSTEWGSLSERLISRNKSIGAESQYVGVEQIPFLQHVPVLGPVLFSHPIMLYLTFGLVAPVHVLLFRTRFGLALRAVGENPKAADAAGIHVARMRYIGVLMSSAGAGMAGAYIVLAQVGLFRDTIVSGEGFIALSIVIFGRWSPWKAAAAALVFGAADALQLSLQLFGSNVPPQLLLSLPYVLTIPAISGLFGGKAVQPAALMVPYVKQ